MSQEQGIAGHLVGKMIRNTVRARFRNVYWFPPAEEIKSPAIFVANHHNWHDGYLMYHLVKALGLPSLDWIQEFDSFPLFAKIGGLPYPPDDPQSRAATIRKTIRLMRSEQKSLVLFAEGVLHSPPMVLPLGKSLDLVVRKVPEAQIVPVALKYSFALHERPEAFIQLGKPIKHLPHLLVEVQESLTELLCQLSETSNRPDCFRILAPGTPDVNERWDLRKWRK